MRSSVKTRRVAGRRSGTTTARRFQRVCTIRRVCTISTRHDVEDVSGSSSSWLGSAIQLEEPRVTSTGEYTRPKFHVGVPSESMRGFMNSAGFDTDNCQLPMVRARTKSSGDGNINGTLWLFARCTFR